ncbi:protein transport protein Sec61 subunit gamma [Trichonephila inaurata madagascariensis]|uniref:Protein transport protein Sec61 subunit gamma n=1 Tax=Trichonephila inaurata madagascariensis TaxID=2747483 RepID=A0A8X6IDA2_9ARAC|nr:protein transport protein Sec61 subunit gamma [Trichonephila inaurata madagascariensis]
MTRRGNLPLDRLKLDNCVVIFPTNSIKNGSSYRCTKPDRKEFQKIAMATAIGFAIMGFIGFFVKLIHIPINNIIVGS